MMDKYYIGDMQNPLLQPWTNAFGAPPLAMVAPEHFPPAYDQALSDHVIEIAAIAGDPAPASFANTVLALEKSGALLTKVELVFSNLAAADTNAALQDIELAMAPRLARH
ncbi:MAG: peptidase M3, partial [Oxalobacteraceae bacterium]